eukprot:gene11851-3508_t
MPTRVAFGNGVAPCNGKLATSHAHAFRNERKQRLSLAFSRFLRGILELGDTGIQGKSSRWRANEWALELGPPAGAKCKSPLVTEPNTRQRTGVLALALDPLAGAKDKS